LRVFDVAMELAEAPFCKESCDDDIEEAIKNVQLPHPM
jgi:hypothetical protein